MKELPHWGLRDKHPSIYDRESATAIEMVSKLYGKVNEIISNYNSFLERVEKRIDDFEDSNDKNYEVFTIGLRQEFQDFIDVVELKLKEPIDVSFIEQVVREKINEVVDSDLIGENVENIIEEKINNKLSNLSLTATDDGYGNITVEVGVVNG